jgi:hypothetical protein
VTNTKKTLKQIFDNTQTVQEITQIIKQNVNNWLKNDDKVDIANIAPDATTH